MKRPLFWLIHSCRRLTRPLPSPSAARTAAAPALPGNFILGFVLFLSIFLWGGVTTKGSGFLEWMKYADAIGKLPAKEFGYM